MNNQLTMALKSAVALMSQSRWDDAERALLALKSQNPFDAFVNYNLGNVYVEQKRMHEAIRSYRQALAANPHLVPAMVNLGSTLLDTGDRREALRYVQMALRRKPDDYKLLTNLSIILLTLGEAPDALGAIERAAELAPTEYQILLQWSSCLAELHRWKDAIPVCERAVEAAGGRQTSVVDGTLLAAYSRFSQWDKIPKALDRILTWAKQTDNSLVPLTIAFFADAPKEMHGLAQVVASKTVVQSRPTYVPKPGMTIGYLSPDFREHPVAHMVLEVLRQHDRNAVRVVTIGLVPLDNSGLCQTITANGDKHIDLSMQSDDQAADLIRTEGIDVLVDLAGSTQWSRPGIFSRRPAPVQLLWLGCPATTGAPWYDGYLVDNVVAPAGQEAYCTESLYRLPCCYHPIATGHHPDIRKLTRQMVGLPDDKFLLGLRLQPNKVIPPFTHDLAMIMKRCPEACLWLKSEGHGRDAILSFFEQHGIASDRIITEASFFKKREEYLGSFALADLLIDSFPYGGHSTSGEALATGCPVVTRMGKSIHTRVAGSMLTEFGMTDLITNSSQEYIDRVCTLVHDAHLLQETRERCRNAAENYKQSGMQRLTNALEAAYRHHLDIAPR